MTEVPCNGCTACCTRARVRIREHEDASRWRTVPHDQFRGQLMLERKRDGSCAYLGAGGCTIQHDKPQVCREADCRDIARAVTFTRARKLDAAGSLPIAVWNRGRELNRQAR